MGDRIIGPVVRNNAIILDEIDRAEDLPTGWTDTQESSTYRLQKQRDSAVFGFAVGPQSWKNLLYPPEQQLTEATRTKNGWKINATDGKAAQWAFLGVRPRDLHALAALDNVLMEGEYADQGYKTRREITVVIAVNCANPSGTCFCTSMGTGPKAESGFDLSLTEIIDTKGHDFVVEIGSKRGEEIMSRIPHETANQGQIEDVQVVMTHAVKKMGGSLDTSGMPDLLYRNIEHAQWKDTGSRCLTYGNCTMVCPTCFCSTVEDYTSLDGGAASRHRKRDSCFTMDYSYIHGGSVRYSPSARYRQWLMHKFATWIDQYGTFGCVGCGRCITWCPAGIDVTEELRIIRVSEILDTMSASTKES
jgi:sulfhydrogenase subunit beta (sulfur reductase)